MFGYHGIVWLCKKGCQHRHSNHESVTLRWDYIHCDRPRTTVVQALKHVGVGPRTISSDPDLVLRGRRRSKSEPRESSTSSSVFTRGAAPCPHRSSLFFVVAQGTCCCLETEADDHERENTEQTEGDRPRAWARCSVDSCNLPRACGIHGTVASCSSDV